MFGSLGFWMLSLEVPPAVHSEGPEAARRRRGFNFHVAGWKCLGAQIAFRPPRGKWRQFSPLPKPTEERQTPSSSGK